MTEKELEELAELKKLCRKVCESNLKLLKMYERNLAKLYVRVELIEQALFPEKTGDIGQVQ